MSERRAEDGWIEWTGGNTPVSGDTSVLIKRRKFKNPYGPYPAVRFETGRPNMWAHESGFFGHDDDIIAYRVVTA